MRFTTPLALLLIFFLPWVIYLGYPSQGFTRRRETASLILRLVLLACLVLSTAGLELTYPAGRGSALGVVFLVDHSDSMPEAARQAAAGYVRQALQEMKPDDQAAVILFGGEALVERPMSSSKELGIFTSVPSASQTNLAEAIQLAMALYPPDKARRMVILSDGAATTGEAETAARLAASTGIEIVVLPLVPEPGAEVLISAVEVPNQLRQGDNFNLELTIEATQSQQTGIHIYSAGVLVYEGRYELKRGSQIFSLPLTAGETGFSTYQVQLTPFADTAYQNNRLAAFSVVSGPPKILMAAPPADDLLGNQGQVRGDEAEALRTALESAGNIVEQVLPFDLPANLVDLAEYTSIILVDVPASQLTESQMRAVQGYVRDLGGGLVVVGGPTSYGVGGYFRTPLEEVLPVEIQIKDEQRRASLAIVFIIDHSGSMSETSGGVIKLELAKEAAMRSVELLMPSDRVGVVAFDDAATWVVPMTDLADPDEIIRSIGTLRPGGGTDILAGLLAMAGVLPGEPALARHVILLTDGGANPAGIPELVSRLNTENAITLSTVGVGRDAAAFLPDLAALGGGRYHFAADPSAIPSIFTEETMLATRSYIIEETFTPRLQRSSPVLEGIDAFPALHGYVGTSPKESAQTILVTHQDDPLLATWQYGLGKVAAFTSDATGRWAKDWLRWQDFGNYWGNIVRSTAGQGSSPALDIQAHREENQVILTVDTAASFTAEGVPDFLNGYAMQANVIDPQGIAQTIQLIQVAPGKYEGIFTPRAEGAYLFSVSGEPPVGGGSAVAGISGWVYSYSAEYRQLEADPDALYRVALAGNGRLASADPAGSFEHSLPVPGASRPVWQWLLLVAVLLLPIDIAVRRLVVSRNDLILAWRKVVQKMQSLRPVPATPLPSSEQMTRLKSAKERTELRKPAKEPNQAVFTSIAPGAKEPKESSQAPAEPAAPPDAGEGQIQEPASTAAALLAKKKARK